MADVMHCPYCDSANIEPYMVRYYKCLDCGRVFRTPVIQPLRVAEPTE